MLIIGEKLNSSIPKTLEALNQNDEAYIIELIKRQADCGADYLDVNTALTGESEVEKMLWVIGLVLEHTSCGIMLDSPNPDVLAQCITKTGGRKVIVNSITLEEKYDALIQTIADHGAGVVCLPLMEKSIPENAPDRLANAEAIIQKLTSANIPHDRIYIDVLAEAIATNEQAGVTALGTIRLLKQNFPAVNTICGLSNVSFGLPGRAVLNHIFLAMAMQNGLSSAIMDNTSLQIRQAIAASNALLGNDEYCLDYISHYREQ